MEWNGVELEFIRNQIELSNQKMQIEGALEKTSGEHLRPPDQTRLVIFQNAPRKLVDFRMNSLNP